MSAIEQALEMHEKWNGKIETTAKSHVNSREDLAIAYTPGVAEPCKVIAKDPDAAYKYTMKANTIAVVSTVVPFSDLVTSEPKPPCLLWKEKQFSLKNSAESTQFRSAWTLRIQKRLLRQLSILHLLLAESTWKISLPHAVLRLRAV